MLDANVHDREARDSNLLYGSGIIKRGSAGLGHETTKNSAKNNSRCERVRGMKIGSVTIN